MVLLSLIPGMCIAERAKMSSRRKVTTRACRVAFIRQDNEGNKKWFCPLWKGSDYKPCTSKVEPVDHSITSHISNHHRSLVPGMTESAYHGNMQTGGRVLVCTIGNGCRGPWSSFNAYLSHMRKEHDFRGPQETLKVALRTRARSDNNTADPWYNYGDKTGNADTGVRVNSLNVSQILDLILEEIAEYADWDYPR